VGNIIVDHCSTSWGMDENLSMYRHIYTPTNGSPFQKLPTVNITLQWCISSEALDVNDHAFGGTWGGRNTGFHHNLFANNTGRNPSIGWGDDFNFVNNVLFNWDHRTVDGGDQTSLINCINNYYKPGPMTPANAPIRWCVVRPTPNWTKAEKITRYGKAYVGGNVVEGIAQVTSNNWDGGVQFRATPGEGSGPLTNADQLKKVIALVRSDKPFPMAPITIQTASEAFQSVLADAGATLPRRDPVDQRIINEVRTGKVAYEQGKGIINDIQQVGGYPEYKGEPVKDLCPDGIPLWWKVKHKLDTNDVALASKDLNGDGYTVVEKYLNGLDPTKKLDWKDPKNNINTLTANSFKAPKN
jgi:hypothetical protein